MKKLTLILLTLLALTLTACGASDSAEAAPVQQATTAPEMESNPVNPTAAAPDPLIPTSAAIITLNTDYTDAASVSEQLLAGTFLLEGTDQAVGDEQAAALLPLWTSLRDASQNTVATQEQIDAIIAQIESAMAPDQIAAITLMQITRESMMTSLQPLGLSMGGPGQGGGMGTPPAGGPGGNGNGGMPPAGIEPTEMGTPQVGQPGGRNFLPPQLIEALIQLLQGKIAS